MKENEPHRARDLSVAALTAHSESQNKREAAAPAHMRRWFDNVPPPYHPVNNDSYTRHLNTALRAVTRSLVIKRQL